MNASTQMTCPNCKRDCLLQEGIAPGTALVCPHCGAPLTAPAPAAPPPLPPQEGGAAAGTADDQKSTLTARPGESPGSGTEALEPLQPAPPASGPAIAMTEVLDHTPRPPSAADAAGASRATTDWGWTPRTHAEGPGFTRYVERRVVGRGGMGEVILCIDRNIRREIALKRILPQAAEDAERRARFVEEAQVTGQLEHPNIVPVHELDKTADGTMYFTMKLVKGQSLSQILRSAKERAGWHSLGDFLQIFLKVCDGVGFAHSRGVIHRDLKPANIMIGDYGEVMVMDWGIAKVLGRTRALASATSTSITSAGASARTEAGEGVVSSRVERGEAMTAQGSALGTPGYMSPEQAEGRLELIDARSDIYSLGAILYEILTLERPIEGDTTLALLANTLRGKIVPPEERTPSRSIPRALAAIAMRCLSRNREDRYPSVAHLKREINLFLEGRAAEGGGAFGAARPGLARRGRGWVFAAVAASILLALAGVLAGHLAVQGSRARTNEQRAIKAQRQQREAALAASEAQAKLAIRALEQGHVEEAAARAETVAGQMDDSPWGHYALGVIAFERKQFAAALRHLRTALDRDPAHEASKAFIARVEAAPEAPPTR